MLWKLINNEFDNKLYLEFEYNSLKIKDKVNFKNIKEFIENGIYVIYDDNGNKFLFSINKETNLINIIVSPYLTYTVEGGKLAHEKFLEFIENDKYFNYLIKLDTHSNKYWSPNKLELSYEHKKSIIGLNKDPNEYLEKGFYGEYAIWCIENNQTNKLYKYIKEGINHGTGLIYEDLVSYNIISYSIKRGQYELVRFIFEEYGLGKKKHTTFNNQYKCLDNMDNFSV